MKSALSFTGGKDSTLALTLLSLKGQGSLPDDLPNSIRESLLQCSCEPPTLLVTFAPGGKLARFKAHPLPVIEAQAAALGLPHIIIDIQGPDYLESYASAIRGLSEQHGIQAFVTGDILDVCSNFMGRACTKAGMQLLCPLFDIPRSDILKALWALQLDMLVCCVNLSKFGLQSSQEDAAACRALPAQQAAGGGQICEALPAQQQDAGAACVALPPAAGSTADAATAATNGQPGSDDCSSAANGPNGHSAPQQSLIDPVASLLGKSLTRELHASVLQPVAKDLGLDECGEYGEWHTWVLDGPTYTQRVQVQWEVEVDSQGGHAYLVPQSIQLVDK